MALRPLSDKLKNKKVKLDSLDLKQRFYYLNIFSGEVNLNEDIDDLKFIINPFLDKLSASPVFCVLKKDILLISEQINENNQPSLYWQNKPHFGRCFIVGYETKEGSEFDYLQLPLDVCLNLLNSLRFPRTNMPQVRFNLI